MPFLDSDIQQRVLQITIWTGHLNRAAHHMDNKLFSQSLTEPQ